MELFLAPVVWKGLRSDSVNLSLHIYKKLPLNPHDPELFIAVHY